MERKTMTDRKGIRKALVFEFELAVENLAEINAQRVIDEVLYTESKMFDILGNLKSGEVAKMQDFRRSRRSGGCELLIYHDESDNESEMSGSTPPTIENRLLPTPGAPMKLRKEFDKKILRPKKLVYSDKENQDSSPEGKEHRRDEPEDDHEYWMGLKTSKKKVSMKDKGSSNAGNERVTRSKSNGAKKKNGKKLMNDENDENSGNTVDESSRRGSSVVDKPSTHRKPKDKNIRADLKTTTETNQSKKSTDIEIDNELIPVDEHYFADRYEVGLWIECCNPECKKLRYVRNIHDPNEVQGDWFCHMNPDREINDCSIMDVEPNLEEDQELIEIKYNAGSIVQAKAPGFRWWPGIVDECPDLKTYWLSSDGSEIPDWYHVTFIADGLSRCWLKTDFIKPFEESREAAFERKTKKRKSRKQPSGKCSAEFNRSIRCACAAMRMPLASRLLQFSLLSRQLKTASDKQKARTARRKNVPKKSNPPRARKSTTTESGRVLRSQTLQNSRNNSAMIVPKIQELFHQSQTEGMQNSNSLVYNSNSMPITSEFVEMEDEDNDFVPNTPEFPKKKISFDLSASIIRSLTAQTSVTTNHVQPTSTHRSTSVSSNEIHCNTAPRTSTLEMDLNRVGSKSEFERLCNRNVPYKMRDSVMTNRTSILSNSLVSSSQSELQSQDEMRHAAQRRFMLKVVNLVLGRTSDHSF